MKLRLQMSHPRKSPPPYQENSHEQTGPEQTRPQQAGSEQARSEQARSEQAGSQQTGPEQASAALSVRARKVRLPGAFIWWNHPLQLLPGKKRPVSTVSGLYYQSAQSRTFGG